MSETLSTIFMFDEPEGISDACALPKLNVSPLFKSCVTAAGAVSFALAYELDELELDELELDELELDEIEPPEPESLIVTFWLDVTVTGTPFGST